MYDQIEIDKPNSSICAKIIRGLNILTAVVLISFGVVGIIFMAITTLLSSRFFLIFSPLFLIFFGAMMVAAEFNIQVILENFNFLTTLLGRGCFYIYLSSSVFFYFSCKQSNQILAWVSGLVIFAMGAMYIFLHFCAGEGYYKNLKQQIAKEKPLKQLLH